MLCNTNSIYPNGIDPMMFFQDNNIEKIETINEYNKLISQGKYDEANIFINQQEGIYGYFADFFNAIENRIYNTQDYLFSKPPKWQPFIYYDGDDFPLDDYIGKSINGHESLENYNHYDLEDYTHEELENMSDSETQDNQDKLIIWI